jgi:hypothetical protein
MLQALNPTFAGKQRQYLQTVAPIAPSMMGQGMSGMAGMMGGGNFATPGHAIYPGQQQPQGQAVGGGSLLDQLKAIQDMYNKQQKKKEDAPGAETAKETDSPETKGEDTTSGEAPKEISGDNAGANVAGSAANNPAMLDALMKYFS